MWRLGPRPCDVVTLHLGLHAKLQLYSSLVWLCARRCPYPPRTGERSDRYVVYLAAGDVKCKAVSTQFRSVRRQCFIPGPAVSMRRLGARARDDLRSANRTRQRPPWRFKGAKPRPPKLGGASARATAAARATRSAQGTCHTHRRRFAWPSGAFCLASAPPPRPRAPAAPPRPRRAAAPPAGPQNAGVTA